MKYEALKEYENITYIVPNELRDAINAKLDAAIADAPAAEVDREHLYRTLLAYFNEHGVIPDFRLTKDSGVQ